MTRADELAVDLVVGSVGRFDCLRRLATSLMSQSHRNFRLIVVEQVDARGAKNLLAEFPSFRSLVLTSDRGLSRARNRGLQECSGEIVAFPDDDCWYEADTLALAAKRFAKESDLDILVGVIKTSSRSAFYRSPDAPMTLNRRNIWRVGCSAASFLRASAVDRIGTFDPTLGVGSGTPYQSGEETDFMLRGIDAGLRGMFDPRLTIGHPSPEKTKGRLSRRTGHGYGMGMGAVLRRHSYPWPSALWAAARPLAGAGVALARGQTELAQFRTAVAAGRFAGYFGRQPIARPTG